MIAIKQLDQAGLTSFVQNVATGSALSGAITQYVNASGWLGSNILYVTGGAQNITGVKTFQISPIVPYSGSPNSAPSQLFVTDLVSSLSGNLTGAYVGRGVSNDVVLGNKFFTGAVQVGSPTNTGHAINLAFATEMSGVLAAGGGGSNTKVTGSSAITTPNFTGVGTAVVSYNGTYVIVSGTAGIDSTFSGFVVNNFVNRGVTTETVSGAKTFLNPVGVANPTSTGHAINLGTATGMSGVLQAQITAAVPINNNYTFSGITGNFVNMSFWFDEFSLATGLNQTETFISRDFFFTGYALGSINSGTQGFFSGSFYQRNTFGIKTNFVNFSLNSGQFFTGIGGFNQIVSGMNRVGLDIYRIGTGLTGLSVGLFGVGY